MVFYTGFFDSSNGDRVYNADTFSKPLQHIIKDGVFNDYGELYKVSLSSGMTLRIGTGADWAAGTWSELDAAITVTLAAAASSPRWDRIVIRHDKTSGVRACTVKVLQGTPAATPAYPTVMNTALVKDTVLADVKVNANVSAIVAANIVNRVGTAMTPYVTAPLSAVDPTPVITDLNSTFNTWFNGLKATFTADTVNQLKTSIDTLKSDNVSNKSRLDKLEGDTGWFNLSPYFTMTAVTQAKARIINGALHANGVISPRTGYGGASFGNTSTDSIINLMADERLKAWFDKHNSVSSFAPVGVIISTSGFFGLLSVSTNGLCVSYRNRNPNDGEYLRYSIIGAI